MQRVRIVKRLGIISLVAASLLLSAAQPFEPPPKLYRAKQEDVPRGRSRGISFHPAGWRKNRELEGGADMVGQKFSVEEKDVLGHIYDRDFEKMLGLLKQAEFNWIWVTWSNGWSLRRRAKTART